MRVGVNLLLWAVAVREEHLPLLSQIQKWGADGVEIPVFDPDGSPWEALRAELDRLGMGRTTVTVLPAGTNLIGETAAERQGALDALRRTIDVSAQLGSDLLCGPLYSPVGRLIGRGPNEQEREWCIEGLRAAGNHAAASGVTLAVEPLNRFETYFLNTQAQARSLVDAMDHPNVRQMYDTFHANIEEKRPIDAVADGGRRIAHVHVSACDRGTPGDDHIDYRGAFDALKAIGYDGWLTIESFSHNLTELAGVACIWREVSESEEYVARHGCAMIRAAWAGR